MVVDSDVEAYVLAHAGAGTYAIAAALKVSPRFVRAALWRLRALGLVVELVPYGGSWQHT